MGDGPDFPEPARKAGDWTRAPFARPLPDRWIAMGFRGGARIFTAAGRRIPEALGVGPDPAAERPDEQDLFVDEASRWTIDFERAEAVGMAIRVRAEGALALDPGLDLLLVVGVKGSAGPAKGAETLTRLFEAHRHTEGLAFLRRGVPTNNSEAERSAWREVPLPAADAPAPDLTPPAPDEISNAGRWAAALGLDTDQASRAFGGADGATDTDDDARAMIAALWPATWGYLLEHLADDGVRRHVLHLRRHVLRWVRPGGHHASMRLGSQPYGLMVHSDLDRLELFEDTAAERLLDLLRQLRDRFWRPATTRVPRIGRTGDRKRDLVEVLGQSAASSSYAVRPTIGVEFFANL